jgi:hypothetical protein
VLTPGFETAFRLFDTPTPVLVAISGMSHTDGILKPSTSSTSVYLRLWNCRNPGEQFNAAIGGIPVVHTLP